MNLSDVVPWLGRTVAFDDPSGLRLNGVVLAVDDQPWAPSAWVRVQEGREYPMYRSIDLSDASDIETGEPGPRWGTGGPNQPMKARDA